MAIAPQNIMTKLRGMGDAELAQYAQMHQQDPYIFPLAFQESQNRQHLRASKQAQMAGQTPPKVVQQDIAEMVQAAPQSLPEEVGIGALPAQNMAAIGKAAGGIIAFDEGGEVPRYQVGGTPSSSTPYAIPGLTQSDLYTRAKAKYEANQPLTSTEKALLFSAAPLAAAGDVVMSPINAVRKLVRNPLDTSPEPSMTPLSDARTRALYGDPSLQPTSDSLGRSPSNAEIERQYLGGAAPAVQGDQKTVGSMTADQTVAAARQNNANTNPTAPGNGYSSPSVNSVMAGIDKLLGPREKVPEQADIEKSLEERQKPYFEKLDKKAKEQRDKLGSDREEAMYMAMIKGGFAAAAGTSPYALANIAKGGEAGIADLSESFKELRKAAQEQSKMEMELEKARMDASTGNLKTAWERQDKAKQIGADRDKLVATAYTSINDAVIRSNATIAAANAMPANMRMAMALGTGDTEKERLESGLAKVNALSAERSDLTFAKMYADHVADARRAMQEPMSPTDFAKTIRAAMSAYKPRVVDTDKPGATVYDRPQ